LLFAGLIKANHISFHWVLLENLAQLLGSYNGENIYLYSSAQYDKQKKIHTPNYHYLPKWAVADKLSSLQAIKIIDYKMKNKNCDNLKEINIDIDEINKK